MLRYSIVMLVSLGAAGSSPAASWAEALFKDLSRDFGSVPRGALLTYPFWLTNTTGGPVSIGPVRVSCGCTTAYAQQTELAPGQSTVIYAQMDTRRFYGEKTVTVYVQFTQPAFDEVRLWVKANSHEDIIITPDTLDFGQIKHGTAPTATVAIVFAGNDQWKITSVSSESTYVQPVVKPLPGNTYAVNYQLSARLNPAIPAGNWRTDVWLETNNPAAPRVRVPLLVRVQ